MRPGTQSMEALRHHGETLRGVYLKHGVAVEGGRLLLADDVGTHLERSRTSVMAKGGLLAEVAFNEAAHGRLQRLELPVRSEGGRFEGQMALGGKAVDVAESPAQPWPKREELDVRKVADWPEAFSDFRPLTQHLHLALLRSAYDLGLDRLLFGVREVKFGNTVEHRMYVFSDQPDPLLDRLRLAIAGPHRRLWGFDNVPLRRATSMAPAGNAPAEVVYGAARWIEPVAGRHLIGGPHLKTFLPPPPGYKVIVLDGATLEGPKAVADAFCRVIQRPKAQARLLNDLGLGGSP